LSNSAKIIDIRDFSQPSDLATDKKHKFKLKRYKGHILEAEDIQFHHNSAVFLAEFLSSKDSVPQADKHINGSAVIRAALLYADKTPGSKLIIVGHTDTSGGDSYNQKLSCLRAKSVYGALMGKRQMWVDAALEKSRILDYQLLIQWVSRTLGWPCDPGKIDDLDGPQTRSAVKNFQIAYNKAFQQSISEDGLIGKQTWGALFDIFMKELTTSFEDDGIDIKQCRSKIQFVDDSAKAVGAGENFPKEKVNLDDYRSQKNRRVEMLWYTPDNLPKSGDYPVGEECKPKETYIYHPRIFSYEPIKVNPAPVKEKPSYKLVELVEVVTQDKIKMVKGVGMDSSDTSLFTDKLERKDKHGARYKQYINVGPDIDGQVNRHPEYGRKLTFRARVIQKDGNDDQLAGAEVVFSFKRTDGPSRSNPGGGSSAVWKNTDLDGNQNEGFSSENGDKTVTVTTDGNGWTAEVSFFLSQYAGDQFKISAKLGDSTKGAAGSKPISIKSEYIVWRKFWYQMTFADGYAAPQPTDAEKAYAEVFTEMVLANKRKFTPADIPDNAIKNRTFFKEYMFKQGGDAAKTVANIGLNSNIDEFATNAKLKLIEEPKTKPIKENLIVCEFQCDPADSVSALKKYKLTADNQNITIELTDDGEVITKPPVKKGVPLVVTGEWSRRKNPWTKGGDITDANVSIDPARLTLLDVKITLPTGAGAPPTPTVGSPIYVRLQVEVSEGFLGWAPAAGIVAVYRPSAAAGAEGSEIDFNDTAAHEFGHKWSQTPEPTDAATLKMEKHPLQYVGHGGDGSHCRHGATVAAGAVDWQNKDEDIPSPIDGDCIMYHQYSTACKHSFCPTCKSYLQLQDMSSF